MIYIACDCEFLAFFPLLPPSNEKSAFWRFLPCCSFGLAMFFSLLHSESRSRQSPGELSFFQPLECLKTSCWFHTLKKKKKMEGDEGGGVDGMALFVTVWHRPRWTPVLRVMAPIDWETMSYTSRYCVKCCCRKHGGRREGDLSLWLWLIQARGSTVGLQTRLCCHAQFIYAFFIQAAAATH